MDHRDLEAMAEAVDIPLLNLLSDRDHPLQALADLLTVKQLLGRLEGARIAYVGDADNNVARSLAQACVLVGAELTLASPEAYALTDAPYGVRHVVDPAEAVADAQIVYTDVWVSMGEEAKTAQRIKVLKPYKVTADVMRMTAREDSIFLHCLPAFHDTRTQMARRRPDICEVSDDVFEGGQSRVFDQAENRMHTAKALMVATL